MPPAVIAGVGAAATIGGAVISSNAQKEAANNAAAPADRTAAINNALARDIFGQNKSALSPFMTRGNQAGDAIMELLGFAPQPANTNVPTPNALALLGAGGSFGAPPRFANQRIMNESPFLGPMGDFDAAPVGNMPQPQVNTPASSAQSAFDRYRASTGYNFRLGEGFKGINTGYAANGLLESGAAQKALLRFGQDMGSGEFGNYLSQLNNQQGIGLSGASALAGVGQNYVGTVSANNNSAGSAAANAALLRGNANSQLYGGIANALGGFAGSFGSSYGLPPGFG